MKNFFLSLRTLLATVSGLSVDTIRMWNNQLSPLEEGKWELFFDEKAVCIEFVISEIEQLGEGRQLFTFIFKLHILHKQRDAGDGTFEQNLDVYDFKDLVYIAVQKFQPGLTDAANPVGSCIRIGEEQDYNHKAVYHFIQSYKTTFVEQLTAEPVNSVDGPIPPLPVEIDETKAENVDNATVYNPAVQYLAVNNTIVYYEDPITLITRYYKIAVNTPNPAGVFDITKWTLLTNIYTFTPN